MADFSIGDVEVALAVMTLYLPDPDEELFAQVDDNQNLREFHPLNRLPLEIRLTCCRMMFPGRRVVNLQPGQKLGYRQPLKSDPFPITLYIDRESRQETLRHYYILASPKLHYDDWGTPYHDFKLGRPPSRICINPLVDSVHLSFFICRESEWDRKFLERLIRENAACFATLKEIELRDVRYKSATRADDEGEKQLYHMVSVQKGNKGLLLLLPSLERLCVTGDRDNSNWWEVWRSVSSQLEEAEELKADAIPLFENHQNLFLTGNTPEIVNRAWRSLRSRF
ncbi:hypothetical protein DL98DRAFT_532449 [Cadophora sp. DSE1049]|nr:hypothetical protein DL98DRAFT_532449 [Cadophora sp. DSE1049]